jgi:uncharacterized protein (TIGR03790 family)
VNKFIFQSICLIGILVLLGLTTATAQQQYDDVALIVNNNSTISGQIATYFASKRAIPAANIIHIAAPTTEEITDADFSALRKQVEDTIKAHGLTTKLNFLVTTKGMPVKVKRTSALASASVESELSLILGKYAVNIGGNGRIASPYYKSRADFSHATFDIYLVTRLDGYTLTDVYGLIDRSSTVPNVIASGAKFVLDGDPSWNTNARFLNTNIVNASTALKAKSLSVMLDTTSTYVVRQTGVMGYASWGSNAQNWSSVTDQAKQYNTYLPGAIGETYVSTSGRSFTAGLTYGQSAIADMIAEGITGVKGYVYEPYASSLADVSNLFPMYAEGYTLAEVFYSSSPYLSWTDVVIGDPKCRIVNSVHNSTPLPVEIVSFTAASTSGSIVLNWKTATESNNYGFDIERKQGVNGTYAKIGFVAGNGTTNTAHSYSYTDPGAASGAYTYRLKQIDNDGQFVYSSEVTLTVTGTEQTSAAPLNFDLGQNYPNPFNPSTMITYSIASPQLVRLVLYDITGRVVATLVNSHMDAGTYSVQWNAGAMPSGVYFYKLDAGNFSSVKKLLLQK